MSLQKCNICLEDTNLLISVNDTCKNDLTILQTLEIVIPFQHWPKYLLICKDCKDLLEASYQFLHLCSLNETEREKVMQMQFRIRKDKNRNDNENYDSFDHIGLMEEMEIITIDVEHKVDKILRTIDDTSSSECLHGFTKDSVLSAEEKEKFTNESDSEIVDSRKCLKCNKTFKNTYILGIHMSTDHGYKCRDCGKGFRTIGSLGQHKRVHHPKILTCEICGLDFCKVNELIKHCTRKHSLKIKDIYPYKCDICTKRFNTSTSLARHIQYHEKRPNFTCKECGKSFVTKKDVEVHEWTHGNEKNFVCQICHKSYKTFSNLRTHIKAVHADPNSRKYQCYICCKRFSLKVTLEEHIMRHIGIKNYICITCGKSFITKHDLKRHTYCHSKDRPYKCNFCEKRSFRDSTYLNDHIEKYHGRNNLCK